MARTLAEAIAAVSGPEFDAAVGYTVDRPAPRPVAGEVAAAFRDFDYGEVRRIERMLVRRHRCQLADAEEAVHDVLVDLLATRPDLYNRDPQGWLGLLYSLARFRVLGSSVSAGRLASIEELLENGDGVLEKARPCRPEALTAADARREPPPGVGEAWTRAQVIGAVQRFRDHWGRPPRSTEFRAINGLPSTAVIYRHFPSLADAIVAAGMMPEVPRRARARWHPLEAARACRSFRRRHGHWPSSTDIARRPGELPSATVMVRCFGGTRPAVVQSGAEAILAAGEE